MVRKAVKTVCPGISKKEPTKDSCHSIRVWAGVYLDKEGMSPEFIKKRLRWLNESYWVYLRDTYNINELQNAALKESANHVVKVIKLIHKSGSDQSFEKHAPELGEYDHGY